MSFIDDQTIYFGRMDIHGNGRTSLYQKQCSERRLTKSSRMGFNRKRNKESTVVGLKS